jgi:YD repeat-containing protein
VASAVALALCGRGGLPESRASGGSSQDLDNPPAIVDAHGAVVLLDGSVEVDLGAVDDASGAIASFPVTVRTRPTDPDAALFRLATMTYLDAPHLEVVGDTVVFRMGAMKETFQLSGGLYVPDVGRSRIELDGNHATFFLGPDPGRHVELAKVTACSGDVLVPTRYVQFGQVVNLSWTQEGSACLPTVMDGPAGSMLATYTEDAITFTTTHPGDSIHDTTLFLDLDDDEQVTAVAMVRPDAPELDLALGWSEQGPTLVGAVEIAYDADGRASTVQDDQVGYKIGFETGAVLRAIVGDGHVLRTRFVIEGGRVAQVVEDGVPFAYTYSPVGLVTAIEGDGALETRAYDAHGEPTSIVRSDGTHEAFVYDALGHPLSYTLTREGESFVVVNAFDGCGNVIQQTLRFENGSGGGDGKPPLPPGPGPGGGGSTTSWALSYAEDCRVLDVVETSPDGALRAVGIDEIGRIASQAWTLDGRTTSEDYEYETASSLLSQVTQTRPTGDVRAWTFAYDEVGELTDKTGPDGEHHRSIDDDVETTVDVLDDGTEITTTREASELGRMLLRITHSAGAVETREELAHAEDGSWTTTTTHAGRTSVTHYGNDGTPLDIDGLPIVDGRVDLESVPW